ncbi:uncharacterized protein [Palaemon carinicauda]|uniref:uncharacterized protein n=1 Tax=Palaemon carinicauda TaxID=392227 RepID=UPI0035B64F47
MKDLMTIVDALMNSHFTTFKTSINASTPDEVDNYATSTEAVGKMLFDADSYASTPLRPAASNLALHISATTDAYAHLLMLYSVVFYPELCQTPMVPTKHGIYSHIKTTGLPVFARFRHLAPDRLAAISFAKMEEMGLCKMTSKTMVITLTHYPEIRWVLHPCGDYRRLNMQTELDHYPLPDIVDVTYYLHKAKIFSMLDLLKGCYQVPMNPEDIPKTTTFNYSFFGAHNTGARPPTTERPCSLVRQV